MVVSRSIKLPVKTSSTQYKHVYTHTRTHTHTHTHRLTNHTFQACPVYASDAFQLICTSAPDEQQLVSGEEEDEEEEKECGRESGEEEGVEERRREEILEGERRGGERNIEVEKG